MSSLEPTANSGQTSALSAEFPLPTACRLVGLTPAQLARLERAVSDATGWRPSQSLTFADLVALAVVREVLHQLAGRIDEVTVGLAELFVALASRRDVERLSDHVAVVGRAFARLVAMPNDEPESIEGAVVVIPLRPILAAFRDQVFS